MNSMILDCTLRDGGYINNWEFGESHIKSIIENLSKANIDIIECGFLNNIAHSRDFTLFDSVDKVNNFIVPENKKQLYVAMIQLGKDEVDINKIPEFVGAGICGIRLIFNSQEIDKAINYYNILSEKGYRVFMQPVKITFCDDETILSMIKKINKIEPYAFYLVDTFGSMNRDDLLRLFYLVDNNLKDGIKIGFHSHNNLQLAFSNAQTLLELKTKRDLIIDSSVFGMGRGAGNLSTELIAKYINENSQNKYDIPSIMNIYDEHLSQIFAKHPWGYSLPYFLSAVNNCHPNYATYLLNKQTLSAEMINILLNQITYEKKMNYDESFIEKLYLNYQKHKIDDKETRNNILKSIKGRKILVLGSGKTISSEKEKIDEFINRENPIVVSVNFEHDRRDFSFISNLKRFNNFINNLSTAKPIIVTSNITTEDKDNIFVLNYESLLLDDSSVIDNAGLMFINLLIKYGFKEVYLGGFDGFSKEVSANYFSNELLMVTPDEAILKKNESIKKMLKKLGKTIKISYITTSAYAENKLL